MRATLSYNFSSTWQRVAVTEFKRGEGILWKYIYSFQIKCLFLGPNGIIYNFYGFLASSMYNVILLNLLFQIEFRWVTHKTSSRGEVNLSFEIPLSTMDHCIGDESPRPNFG